MRKLFIFYLIIFTSFFITSAHLLRIYFEKRKKNVYIARKSMTCLGQSVMVINTFIPSSSLSKSRKSVCVCVREREREREIIYIYVVKLFF